MKKLTLFLILFHIANFLLAQKYTTADETAIKLYNEAKTAMVNRDYKTASSKLKKALDKDYKFVEAHIQMAQIYKFNFVPRMEQMHYEKAVEYNGDPKRFTNIYYTLGNLYFKQGKYEESKKMYEDYVNSGKGKEAGLKEAKRNLIACEYAVEAMKDSTIIAPKMMPPQINAFSAQYFPSLTANEIFLVYTAITGAEQKTMAPPEKEMKKSKIPKSDINELFVHQDENVLVSRKDQHGNWTPAVSISKNINSKEYSEGATAISGDGKSIVMTICNHPKGEGGCDLYFSKRKGDDWSVPENLGPKINTTYKETYPTLSPDGRTMYFCSDRPGGKGGLDIWRSQLEEDGWSAPDNVGEPINTEGNEISPFIHANNHTLYFGSDFHIGFGGYDNFMSELTADAWTKPKNLGYPINSYQDEGTLFISPNGKKGYFSKKMGSTDDAVRHKLSVKLFEFDVPNHIKPSILAGYAQGLILDIDTKEKLDASVDLHNLETNKLLQKVHSDPIKGDYVVTLNHGGEYALYVSREGYLFESVNFNFKEDSTEVIEMDIYLKPIEVGQSIILNNMFFESGSYKLDKKSETELKKIIHWMDENSDVRMEISGYTDDVGSDSYNQTLSLNRAKEVYNYLIKNNISPGYLTYKGYGKEKPIAENTTEEGRRKNRRIEFKIIPGFDD